MWSLVDKKTSKALMLTRDKSYLLELMAKAKYQRWEIVYEYSK